MKSDEYFCALFLVKKQIWPVQMRYVVLIVFSVLLLIIVCAFTINHRQLLKSFLVHFNIVDKMPFMDVVHYLNWLISFIFSTCIAKIENKGRNLHHLEYPKWWLVTTMKGQ